MSHSSNARCRPVLRVSRGGERGNRVGAWTAGLLVALVTMCAVSRTSSAQTCPESWVDATIRVPYEAPASVDTRSHLVFPVEAEFYRPTQKTRELLRNILFTVEFSEQGSESSREGNVARMVPLKAASRPPNPPEPYHVRTYLMVVSSPIGLSTGTSYSISVEAVPDTTEIAPEDSEVGGTGAIKLPDGRRTTSYDFELDVTERNERDLSAASATNPDVDLVSLSRWEGDIACEAEAVEDYCGSTCSYAETSQWYRVTANMELERDNRFLVHQLVPELEDPDYSTARPGVRAWSGTDGSTQASFLVVDTPPGTNELCFRTHWTNFRRFDPVLGSFQEGASEEPTCLELPDKRDLSDSDAGTAADTADVSESDVSVDSSTAEPAPSGAGGARRGGGCGCGHTESGRNPGTTVGLLFLALLAAARRRGYWPAEKTFQ